MGRYATYGQRDTRDFTDGDPLPDAKGPAWLGIDMTRAVEDRGQLPPKMLARGENTRLLTGGCAQRPGTTIPSDFIPSVGFGNIIVGTHVYTNPNSDEVMLVAPANAQYVWALQYGKTPVKINYSATEIASGRTNGQGFVRFVQAFEKVLMFRIPTQAGQLPLVWDGNNANKFEIVALSATGKTLIQNFRNGETFMDRILYYNDLFPVIPGRDTFWMSDVLDYTSYDPSLAIFRVNPGASDYITRIMGYFRSSVLVLKNQSIHMVSNFTSDVFLAEVRELSADIGSIGAHIPLMVGRDVIFLNNPGGFYRISEVIADQIATAPVPISEKIQPVIDQINWSVTQIYGWSQLLGQYAFFGVALGPNALGCNAMLVLHTPSGEWHSAPDRWKDPDFEFHSLHVTNYANGTRRLYAVDWANAVVYLMYEGINDDLVSGVWGIPYVMETRGYGTPMSFSRFSRVRVSMATYDPSANITAITDGVNEEKLLTPNPITKDRTRFYIHGHKRFDVLTDDPTEPKREDYSISEVDNKAFQDYEDLPAGPVLTIPGTSPIVAGDKQQSLERRSVRQIGRWTSIRVENDEGVCDVLAIGVDGIPIKETVKAVA